MDIINKRFFEVKNFFDIKKKYGLTYEYTNVLLLKALPFRDTTDLNGELNVIANLLNININSYVELIVYMSKYLDNAYDPTWVISWLDRYNIANDSFSWDNGSWILGRKAKQTKSYEEIQARLNDIYFHHTKERNELLGDFAEHIVFNYLNSYSNLGVELVSKTVGDGLGYDIVSQDKSVPNNIGKYDFYEVKADGNGMLDFTLTKNETRMLRNINNNSKDENYHIIIVPTTIKDVVIAKDIVDITYQNGKTNINSVNDYYYLEEILPLEKIDVNKHKVKLLNGRIL